MSRRKIYRSLISVDEVIPTLERYRPLKPLGEVRVPLPEALGRVLSRNVYAAVNYPPYTRSLVDGYAVLSEDLAGVYEDRPKRLKLTGRVSTGETRVPKVERGECVEVSTGAVVPYPADAVVPVEYTHTDGESVVFYRSVARGENIDLVGSDFAEGEVAAWKGETVTPLLATLLAALGVDRVYVYKPVRVGILPTGGELRDPGDPLSYGQVYDSNSYLVYSYVKLLGAEPRVYERALDDPADVEAKIWRTVEENDLVVTIGGTSAGLEDLVYKILSKLDPGIIVHGVKEKPGRPLVVAVHGEKIVLGLPGFPLSCLLTVNLYLTPILARLQGLKTYEQKYVSARIPVPVRGQPGIRVFTPVILVERGGCRVAYPLPGHSGKISSLSLVDGYAVLGEDVEYLPAGGEVEVLLNPFWSPYDVNVIGSHDPLLQSILDSVSRDKRIRIVNVGSMAGLQAVKTGVADLAGVHLLDPKTGEYNLPFLKELKLKDVILVRGYLREQGFVYRKETEVNSIADVIDGELRFVNRNPGSGTRILVDLLVSEEAERRGIPVEELQDRLKGYRFEVKTHEAVAYLVSKDVVDVGVAVRYVAEKYNLGFTPVSYERYDLVARKDSTGKEPIRLLLEEFKTLVGKLAAGFPGYKLDSQTGEKIEL